MLSYFGENLFGERKQPCGDCVEIDGKHYCTMNCGPCVPPATPRTVLLVGGRRSGKTDKMMAEAVKAATPGNRVLVVRSDGCHEIRNVTKETEK